MQLISVPSECRMTLNECTEVFKCALGSRRMATTFLVTLPYRNGRESLMTDVADQIRNTAVRPEMV